MWFYKEDKTKPVFTSYEQVQAELEGQVTKLGQTALILYMNGLELIKDKYHVSCLPYRFPRFLSPCPIYQIENKICLLDGGRGAPMAADTLETLHALGVSNVISVGLLGGFVENVKIGDLIIPNCAYIEEGTSLHYKDDVVCSWPSQWLFDQLVQRIPEARVEPIVSTDAVYRQTFYKEALWRKQGCIGVDMETSALMTVGKYLGMHVASILMVSDKHPLYENDQPWEWQMTHSLRKQLLFRVVDLAFNL